MTTLTTSEAYAAMCHAYNHGLPYTAYGLAVKLKKLAAERPRAFTREQLATICGVAEGARAYHEGARA